MNHLSKPEGYCRNLSWTIFLFYVAYYFNGKANP